MVVRGEPAFLSQVMDTIANLKESKGSPPDRILDHMAALRKAPLRNASLRVKKALRTGLRTGLLKESGGKFKLGLTTRDYAVLKRFGQLGKRSGGLSIPVREHRRRRGRGRRRRGRRRRRSNVFSLGMGEDDSAEEDSGFKDINSSSKTGELPVKELRRRGRRGRSRRRRGRRRRRSDLYDVENLVGSDESGGEPMDRGRRRRGGRRRGRRRRGRRRGFGPEDDVDSIRSTESKDISSEEKPKTAKGRGRREVGGKSEPEKREIVTSDPPRSHIDHQENVRSSHCIHEHGYHHEGPYSHHPPPPPPHSHYGEHYYE